MSNHAKETPTITISLGPREAMEEILDIVNEADLHLQATEEINHDDSWGDIINDHLIMIQTALNRHYLYLGKKPVVPPCTPFRWTMTNVRRPSGKILEKLLGKKVFIILYDKTRLDGTLMESYRSNKVSKVYYVDTGITDIEYQTCHFRPSHVDTVYCFSEDLLEVSEETK